LRGGRPCRITAGAYHPCCCSVAYARPSVGESMRLVREPDAGDLHVRFDERDVETGLRPGYVGTVRRRDGNRQAKPTATAPHLDSTVHAHLLASAEWRLHDPQRPLTHDRLLYVIQRPFGRITSMPATGQERSSVMDNICYRMTSSARSSSDCGIAMSSAWAVLRLTTSSSLVGCSTGRSPGLAPLRILSTKIAALRNSSVMLGP